MKRLADEHRAAFCSATGHEDGWQKVADLTQVKIDAAIEARFPRIGTDDFEFRRLRRMLHRYDVAKTETQLQVARGDIFREFGILARTVRGHVERPTMDMALVESGRPWAVVSDTQGRLGVEPDKNCVDAVCQAACALLNGDAT